MYKTASKNKFYMMDRYTVQHSNNNTESNQSRFIFNDELNELWWRNQTSELIQKAKYNLASNLEELFRDVFPYIGLYIIGSTVNGFGLCTSELDICLMVTHDTLNDLESGLILQKIGNIFRKGEYFQQVELVKRTFPMLIFFDIITSIKCNIYLNEIASIRNTFLMRFYSECDHRLPVLMTAIQYWASKVNLKSRTHNGLHGYCLTLMCIYYLQTALSPSPIAPRFPELLPAEKFDATIDIRKLDLLSVADLAKTWSSTNMVAEVGDLFVGFLKFYAFDFDFQNDVVSVRIGRKMNKRESTHEIDRINRYIVIEEPLTSMNVASQITTDQLYQEVLHAFRSAYEKLSSTRRLSSL